MIVAFYTTGDLFSSFSLQLSPFQKTILALSENSATTRRRRRRKERKEKGQQNRGGREGGKRRRRGKSFKSK